MKIRNVQALRGVAALIVLVIHLMPHNFGIDWMVYNFWWVGPAGVDIFFVISGFIVCYSASRAISQDGSSLVASGKFAVKRAVRIFPVYWVALAVAWLVAPHINLAPAPEPLPEYHPIRYILLLNVHNNKIRQAWTMAYEIYFYAMLAVLILFRSKDIYRLVAAWIVAEIVAVGVAACVPGFVAKEYVPLSPLILEFCAGCVVAFLIDKGVKGAGWASLIYGVVLFSLGCYINSKVGNWEYGWRALLFGPSVALVLYGLIEVERNGFVLFPRAVQKLGDASYSIYIWHYMLFLVCMHYIDKYSALSYMPGWTLVLMMIALSIAVGFVSYYIIEKPSQSWIHRALGKSKLSAEATPA
jgi:peptidoglycan/LPS O-acetylase OafA/YrhL